MIDEVDDTDDDFSEVEFARMLPQPKPVFERPGEREVQQRGDIISSSSSSGVGDSEGVCPLVYF